ncbi:MAG TPA: hypothetical protein VJW20_06960 [Candidatus Angelobacter sp.]|nr:hypothetical protein [Candidatus Angelobacter sp.]
MRRFLSITTVLSLFFTMSSPIMAATCTGAGKTVSCHSMAVSHCDRHEHHHHAAEASTASSITAADSDEKCPMDCCIPGHRASASVAYSPSFLPPLAVSDQNVHVVPVHFISAGFSSHTDRGPPLA